MKLKGNFLKIDHLAKKYNIEIVLNYIYRLTDRRSHNYDQSKNMANVYYSQEAFAKVYFAALDSNQSIGQSKMQIYDSSYDII